LRPWKKGDELPEKEPIKQESKNDIKPKEPVTETVNTENVDEKKTSSNGNHTPV